MTIRRSLALIALQCAFVFVLGFMVVLPRICPDPERPLTPSFALTVFIVVCALFGGVALVWWASVRSLGRTWRDLGWHVDGLGRQLAFGAVGGAIGCLLVFSALLVTGISPSEILTSIREASATERLTFALIGVQAAFIEESLFRGNLLPALRARMPSKLAIPVSAAAFALYHLRFNPVSLGTKMGLGLTYGVLRVTQGSLIAPALAHAMVWLVAGSL
jgi:membrane protease YdiL (CAAX protease family)